MPISPQIASRIAALRAKTTENGCTEEEALSAANKVREMLERYHVDLSEAELSREDMPVLRTPLFATSAGRKLDQGMQTKARLCHTVGTFTGSRCWRSGDEIEILGLRPDAEFALWLLDSLAVFIEERAAFALGLEGYRGAALRDAKLAFAAAAVARIGERLRELAAGSGPATGNALVVVKTTMVARRMRELDIHLVTRRSSSGGYDPTAQAMGRRAGDGAGFGRPVAASALRIGRG